MFVDFGKAATDYARYRIGFPDRFFEQLFAAGLVRPGSRVLDLGTGTGNVARGFATRGCIVTGLDKSAPLLEQAKLLDREAGLRIDYVLGTAEQTGLASHSFDAITAGQCWHWFERPKAAAEARRLLVRGGPLVLAHISRLPLAGGVVEATEKLIRKHNPTWYEGVILRRGVNRDIGIQLEWFGDLYDAEFRDVESFTFDIFVPYSHEAWLGRIRASSGVAASLSPDAVQRFNAALQELLTTRFPAEPLRIPHRVFGLIGRVP
jgi:ubiquinone/menaquinone biosynthesis C-methylase UbiE